MLKNLILTLALFLSFAAPVWATGKPEQPKPQPVEIATPILDSCARDSLSIRCPDKQAHFAAHVLVGVVAADLARDKPYWQRFGLAMAPGFAKEVLDPQISGQKFSWKDMAWNAAGVAVGLQAGGWFIARQQQSTVVGFATQF